MRLGSKGHRQRLSHLNLGAMALTVIEGDAVNFVVLLQCLNQAGRGILSTAENDNRAFHKITSI
ncbi:hypothetical protein D3C85_1909750 [compost metagenome]